MYTPVNLKKILQGLSCQIHLILTKLPFLTHGHGIDISFIYTEVVSSELLIHVLHVCSRCVVYVCLCAHI